MPRVERRRSATPDGILIIVSQIGGAFV